MLGWTMMELAKAATLSVSMVKDLEDPERRRVSEAGLGMVRAAMTKAGVSFLADNGEGPGLRLSAGLRER
jgi:hypothetical protein